MRDVAAMLWVAVLAAGVSASDPFEVTTPGVPGSGGVIPTLVGEGPATPNSANTLSLADAAPSAPAMLVFSMSELAAPYGGGVLGPAPDFVASLGMTDARGALERRFRMPVDAPAGLELWLQAWVTDAGGVAGLSASNTVKAVVQPHPSAAALFPGVEYAPTFTELFDVAVADLNGDERADMVVVNRRGLGAPFYDIGHVEVLLAEAGGSFSPPAFYATGTQSNGVAIGDLDGDGALDLAVANRGSADVALLFGAGDGSFEPSVVFPAGAGPWSVGIGDFDADGTADLAVANIDSDSVSILRGLGARSFSAPGAHPAGDGPRRLTIADLDDDGALDVIVACAASDALALLRGTGDGGFLAAELLAAGDSLDSVIAADMDRDGVLDLVASSRLTDSVVVLPGLGDGAFAPPVSHPVGDGPLDVDVADLNHDGWLDIATADIQGNTTSVLLSVGGGTFAPATIYPAGEDPRTVLLTDLDGDGESELVVGNAANSIGQQLFAGEVLVLDGNGDGGFEQALQTDQEEFFRALAVGDIDEDGRLDVALGGITGVTARFGDGQGGFAAGEVALPDGNTFQVFLEDIDGDEHLDLLAYQPLHRDSPRMVVLHGDGTGSWSLADPLELEPNFNEFTLVDVDGDLAPDLVSAAIDAPELHTFLNNGRGGWAADAIISQLASEEPAVLLASGHIDGDGILDLAVRAASAVQFLRGVGDGSFSLLGVLDNPASAGNMTLDDLDGDGFADLVAGYSWDFPGDPLFLFGGLFVRLGTGDATFAPPEFYYLGRIGGQPSLADVNADGLQDVVMGASPDSFMIMLGLGGGDLAPPVAFQATPVTAGIHVAHFDSDARLDIMAWSYIEPAITVSLNQLDD